MSWISTFAITKIYWWKLGYISMNQMRKPSWISCALKKKILQGVCSSPWLQYLRYYGVLPLLNHNLWILLCHSQFYVFCGILHLCRIDLWMLPRLSRFLTCHNDVIDAEQNNRLFAPGIDMDDRSGTSSFITHAKRYVLCINIWHQMLQPSR